MTRQHKVLLDHVDKGTHSDNFENITGEEHKTARVDAEEWYLPYVLLKKSGRKHVKLNSDKQNDYTTGDYRYPKTHQNTLHLLTHYTNPTIQRNGESQGSAFSQKTGNGRNTLKYENVYLKDKDFYNCHKKGHPYYQCPNRNKKKDDDNNKSKFSTKINQY